MVGGVAVVSGLSGVLDIAQYTINVCSLIGLGVAIASSLFTVSRYREELAHGLDTRAALGRAMATSGRMVCFSGVAVGTGLAGLLFFKGSYLWAMGLGGAIVVGLAVIFALTFLPALLAVLGRRINAGRIPRLRLGPAEGFWHRTAMSVMRRPLLVLIPTLSALLLMGVPFLHLRMAAADARVRETRAIEARHGYETLREAAISRAGRQPRVDRGGVPRGADRHCRTRQGPVGPLAAAPPHRPRHKVEPRRPARGGNEGPGCPAVARSAICPAGGAEGPRFISQPTTRSRWFRSPPMGHPGADARAVVRAVRAERWVGDGEIWVKPDGQRPRFDGLHPFAHPRSDRLRDGGHLPDPVSHAGIGGAPDQSGPDEPGLDQRVASARLVWIFQDGHLFVREPRRSSLRSRCCCLCADLRLVDGLRGPDALAHQGEPTIGPATLSPARSRCGPREDCRAHRPARRRSWWRSSARSRSRAWCLIQARGSGNGVGGRARRHLPVRVLMVPATMRLFGDLNWWAPKWMLGLRKSLGAG